MNITHHSRYRKLALPLLIAGLLGVTASRAAPVPSEHIETELLSENKVLGAGDDAVFGLRMKPEAGWHVYWRNPGDSGLPTRINWTLPPGVSAGDIQWPYPHREVLGDIVNYGYGDETMLLVPLAVPKSWPAGKPLPVKAEAKWLICKDICIPESASYALELPVGAQAQGNPALGAAFAQARASLPMPMPAEWRAQFAIAPGPDSDPAAGELSLALNNARLPAAASIAFFPSVKDLVNHSAPQRVARESDGLRLSQALNPAYSGPPKRLSGVLVASGGGETRAYEVDADPGEVQPVVAEVANQTIPAVAAHPGGDTRLSTALLFAFLGGLILNLMPCVFPVLSLKALALAEAGGRAAAHRRRDALAYTAGILLSFIAVAALLIALRAGGQALGWGFQLQSPSFVALLAELMFALGLSMSGLAVFGTRFMGAGQKLTERGGAAGAFFTGVLAAVVASPCSAPYMGTALGYALIQPPGVALGIFAALGVGLASPFLLLGFVPALAARLPRPGVWMETFKELLAFPLYLTSAWLIWVLARQSGADAAGLALFGLVAVAFALWLLSVAHKRWTTILAYAAIVLAVGLTLAPTIRSGSPSGPQATADAAIQPFSEQKLAELRGQHKRVFVNFTADWCLSCKVNERVALRSDAVREAFASHDVVWLEGDWTRYDPEITKVLGKFGRSGVPLYLLYGSDGAAPQVLPQILTPDVVVAAVQRAR